MYEIKTILCAIALSENSDDVISRALREAQVHNAVTHILHILPSPDAIMATPVAILMGGEKFRTLIEEHREELESTIRGMVEGIKDKVLNGDLAGAEDRIAGIHVIEGDPVIEILDMSKSLKADMLVMGTHTKGLTEHTFFGNVARKVLKRTRVPVLVVPPVKG